MLPPRKLLESLAHGDPSWELAGAVDAARVPAHIAIIMDGNGRWARSRGLPRIEGHRRGVRSVRETIEECAELGIDQLTLYCLSSENWKRPQRELDMLMRLADKAVYDAKRQGRNRVVTALPPEERLRLVSG